LTISDHIMLLTKYTNKQLLSIIVKQYINKHYLENYINFF
jgi:hypothetical protein